jgi:hypothetical protein
MITTKFCKGCNQEKTIDDFFFRKKNTNSYQSKCKECQYSLRKKRYWSTPEDKRKKLAREKMKKLVESGWTREYRMRTRFGISIEEYEKMLSEQNGGCAICGSFINNNLRKNLAVDHCHNTGKVRGLLCHKCNSGIGFFDDDINLLENAISYLKDSL